MVVVTVRVIKSFEYRTCKNIILADVDLEALTAQGLYDLVMAKLPAPFVKPPAFYNVFKIYSQPHGAKTNSTIINAGKEDELCLKDWNLPLAQYGIQHETEISLFNNVDYRTFIQNPSIKWF
jgi:hypothetical protein